MWTFLYHEVLIRPLFNTLISLYNIIPGHDFGVAIIVLTIIIRVILYPLNQKSIYSQKALQDLQPKIKEIQQKYKNDKEKQSRALIELYKNNKINPASGCLPIIIQLPILFALFSVFKTGLDPTKLNALYSFVHNPGEINHFFIGLVDLSQKNIVLAVLAGVAQFWQSRMLLTIQPSVKSAGAKDESMAAAVNKQMVYFLPILTVFITATLPAGLAVYWLTVTLFGIIQQYLVFGKTNKKDQNLAD